MTVSQTDAVVAPATLAVIVVLAGASVHDVNRTKIDFLKVVNRSGDRGVYMMGG
jgi:hypothetical protein